MVTDKDFSADQAAILKYVELRANQGGGVVNLGQGHFIVKPINDSACLQIPSGITLKGEKEGTIIHEITDTSDQPTTTVWWDLVLFTGENNTGGGVVDCTFRHTGGRRNNTGTIAIRGGANTKKIIGNIIENTIGSAIAIEYNVNNPKPLKCIVRDNNINPTARHGVYIIGCTHNTIENNIFNVSALESIAIRGSHDQIINNNQFFGVEGNTSHAITLAAPTVVGGYQYYRLKITNNHMHQLGGAGFYGQGVGCQMFDSEISGNTINLREDALTLSHSIMLYRTQRTVIARNTINGGQLRGIMLYGSSNNTIIENKLINLNALGANVGVLFLGSYTDSFDSTENFSTSNTIKDNLILDTRTTKKHVYGIQLTTGCNNNFLQNNEVTGATSSHIYSVDGVEAQIFGKQTDKIQAFKADVAVGTISATLLNMVNGSTSYKLKQGGFIRSFTVEVDKLPSSGNVTVTLYKNGLSLISATISSTDLTRNITYYLPQTRPVSIGDEISFRYSTTAITTTDSSTLKINTEITLNE